jgi:ligand-binding sensor domain-containing protein/signal transduction histidine kinase
MKNLLKATSFAIVCGLAAKEGLNAQSRSVDAITPPSSHQDVAFDHISTEQGPSTGTIYCIVQDQQGFLWLGTANGLLRYDGYEFKAYKHHPADSNSISGNHVWSICEDHNGDLWVGTSGRGLNRYIRNEDRFIRYQHDPNDSASLAGDYEVPWIYEDAAGEIWIALWELGLDHYNRSTNRFDHHRLAIKDEQGVPRSSVHRIYEDSTGLLWIGTKRGVIKWDRERNTIITYQHDPRNPRSLGGDYIYSILEDRSGNLWFGAAGGGLSRYDRCRNEFVVYRHDPNDPASLSGNDVSAIAEDGSGILWIATFDGGLNRFDPTTGKFARYRLESSQVPSAEGISSLLVDRTGILWVGTVGAGLYCYAPEKRKFSHYRHRNGRHSVLVDALCESSDHSLWIGTSGNGLYRLNREDEFKQYMNDANKSNSLSSNFVTALSEDIYGNLWVGTYGGGINRFDPKNESFVRYRHDPNDPLMLTSDLVNTLLADSRGNLWVGTDGMGLNLYNRRSNNFQKYLPDSTTYPGWYHIMALFEDRQGDIWVGTWGYGVIKFTPLDNLVQGHPSRSTVPSNGAKIFTAYRPHADDRSTISGPNVISIAEDTKGNLWFGTWGEGLNRFDRVSNKFTRYTSAEGLPNDIVYGILPDDQGNLWISTNHGLARFNPEIRMWKEYEVSDGVQSTEFRRGAYHKGRSGRFYFGGINGFNAFYPQRIRNNPHVPPVVITDFQIFNKSVKAGPASLLKKAVSQTDRLTLSYKQNVFSFEFAALDYTAPKKNRYAYMLEGFHDGWIDLGARRFVTFTNLDAGEYVFRVKGSNNDGVWNEEGASIKIRITPPPWKTWWAYAIYAGLFVGALLLLRRYELSKVREKNRLREAQLRAETAEFKAMALEAEKEVEKQQIRHRIAADLHDEIGSNLSSITLLSEILQNQSEINGEFRSYFADIHQAARSSTEAVRDIVWFVNPGSDQLNDLIARLEAAARSMLVNISYEFHRPASPSSAKLNPEVKRNIYLIYKEILANIIKHSRANRVRIEIREDDGNFALRIEDDGVGFNAAIASSGRGLINLRERAAQIGGQLTIQTTPGQGTLVALNAKIT